MDRRRSVELARLINKAGVRPSVRHRRVGNLELTDTPLAEGPGWQDYLARHPMLDSVRRVRFYLVDRSVSDEERAATLRAAKREFVTLENVNHPGIARAIEFYEHERGLAVVFDHDVTEVRLDHFLMQQGGDLSADRRIKLAARWPTRCATRTRGGWSIAGSARSPSSCAPSPPVSTACGSATGTPLAASSRARPVTAATRWAPVPSKP